MPTRRHLVLALAAALATGLPRVAAARAASAEIRLGNAALRALPARAAAALAAEGRARRADALAPLAAADYRAGRTLRLGGVTLSRAEVSRAIDAALSARPARRRRIG